MGTVTGSKLTSLKEPHHLDLGYQLKVRPLWATGLKTVVKRNKQPSLIYHVASNLRNDFNHPLWNLNLQPN